MGILLKKGDLIQKGKHHEENQELTISKDSIPEFSFYKNSAAFAFAPFFCELFRDTELYTFVSEFLENTIMGYYESINSENQIDVSALPDWFKTMLRKFFEDKFAIFGMILELLGEGNILKEEKSRHSEIVRKLLPKVSEKIHSATADEIYEMLFFLEKKGVLKENLTIFDKELSQELTDKIKTLN